MWRQTQKSLENTLEDLEKDLSARQAEIDASLKAKTSEISELKNGLASLSKSLNTDL